MKLLIILTSLFLLSAPAYAAITHFEIDPAHSGVSFKVRHMFTPVPGSFKKFAGTFDYDPAKPKSWTADVTIETASIFTDNEKRDTHLRSGDFFDAEKFPKITFKSKEVKNATKKGATLLGDLTMHGVTKPVTLKVEIGGMGKDPWGGMRAGFSATTKVNRKDYGIVWNKALDSGGMLLGDDVEISLAVEGAEPKKEEKAAEAKPAGKTEDKKADDGKKKE